MDEKIHVPEAFKLFSDYQSQVVVRIARRGVFKIDHYSGGERLVEVGPEEMRKVLEQGYFTTNNIFGYYQIQSPELWTAKISPILAAMDRGEFDGEIDKKIQTLAAKINEAQSLRMAMATLEKRALELEGASLYD